jgi:hypothetical protein
MTRSQELASFRVQALTDRLKLLPLHFAAKPEQLRATPLPLSLYAAVLVIIVAVFQMPLRVASAARHGPYR